jgi:hypothetical protein
MRRSSPPSPRAMSAAKRQSCIECNLPSNMNRCCSAHCCWAATRWRRPLRPKGIRRGREALDPAPRRRLKKDQSYVLYSSRRSTCPHAVPAGEVHQGRGARLGRTKRLCQRQTARVQDIALSPTAITRLFAAPWGSISAGRFSVARRRRAGRHRGLVRLLRSASAGGWA